MRKMKFRGFHRVLRAIALIALFGFSSKGFAQIPAFLPMMTEVPATNSLPIDGEWMISSIRKHIRIDGGRAYAVDPWTHLFVLKIEPMMVVMTDMYRSGPGQYRAKDLPLVGEWSATLMPDGVLDISVAGMLGLVKYKLLPVSISDQDWFAQEMQGGAPQHGQQPPRNGQQPPQDQQPPAGEQPPADAPPADPVIGEPMIDPDQGEAPVDPW